jgi:ATP-dependent Clp protease adaptor protein ClpS
VWGESNFPPPTPELKMTEQTKTNLNIRPVLDIEPPKDYKVIYLNDSVTTFEFVCESLEEVFEYSDQAARDKSTEIHEKGSGVVAVLPFEIAEQKGVEVLVQARNHGYPLEVKLEQE